MVVSHFEKIKKEGSEGEISPTSELLTSLRSGKADSSFFQAPDGIDKLILPIVEILNIHGFKTFESCQGGEGHAFFEPTVRFEGDEFSLIRACEICSLYGFIVSEGRRIYRKTPIYRDDNTPNAHQIGETWDRPFNEITFILPS